MIVPHKYNAKYQEKYRQVKYEYYLTRGLAIPPEYMPKEQQEGQHGGQNGGVVDGDGKRKNTFEPQIAMRFDGQGRPEGSGVTALVEDGKEHTGERDSIIRCISCLRWS